MTQNEAILELLREGPVTPMDALRLGCFRLAARVHDLKELGYDIETAQTHPYAIYVLHEPASRSADQQSPSPAPVSTDTPTGPRTEVPSVNGVQLDWGLQ